MNKKVIGLAVLALVFSAVPASAQAQYCFGSPPTCQYLADTGMEQGTTYWHYSVGSHQSTVSDPCASGGGTTGAADLEPGDSVLQEFYTDSLPARSWAIRLDLYKTSTNVTADDYFKVKVYSSATGVTETNLVKAGAYPGLCKSVISFTLSNDYSNTRVRVIIQKNSNATATMYVDNVAFFGRAF
jgi:hypothetical protein